MSTNSSADALGLHNGTCHLCDCRMCGGWAATSKPSCCTIQQSILIRCLTTKHICICYTLNPTPQSCSYLKMFYSSLEKVARQMSNDGSGFNLESSLADSHLLSFGSPTSDAAVLDVKEGGPVLSVGPK